MAQATKVIAVTGGPGGGKSTCFKDIKEKLAALGVRAFFAPEYASMLIDGGVPDIVEIAANDYKKYVEIERQMLLLHLDLKKRFAAAPDIFGGERCVMFTDRGGKDVDSYLQPGIFGAILEDERLNLWDVRDSYDAVIFLRSAACGQGKHYTTANNPARQEKDPEKARRVDALTLKAWIGHPHLWIIPSRENFKEKLTHALRAILHTIRTPSVEIERKFLLKARPDLKAKVFGDMAKASIEQMYLRFADKHARIRKMTQGSYSSYYFTTKTNFLGSRVSREEEERRIGALDYWYLARDRDPATTVIKKNRHYFVWKDQYFSLDVFQKPKPLNMLEIELLGENDDVDLPPFLEIDREVTGDHGYSNYSIARGC